ncbi:MAG TPA: HlyD family efflux transporter periplasmic adaptor subunit [Thermoguttaceae bacterium]
MSLKFKLFILLVLIATASGGVWWYKTTNNVDPQTQIRVSGNIETTVTDVSFKIAGRVTERPVDEGYMVKKGDLVATLDDSDLKYDVLLRMAELQAVKAYLAELEAGSRPEEIAAAEAAMQKAAHALADLEAGSRPQEIAAAEATIRAASAQKAQAQADFARARQLFEKRTISSEQYDFAKTAFDVATERYREAAERLDLVKEGPRKQQIEQARAAFEQAKAQYALVKAGPREETKDQARARVEQADAALRLAETRMSYTKVFSPMSGVVLSKNIEPGEYVAPGTPVVTIGDLVNVWLRAYIQETDLGRIKVGQKADVTTDTYPDKEGKIYQGRVSFIASEAEFTPKNVQTEKERVKLVYRIKIDVTNPNMELKPGMPADAVIEFKP